MTKNLKIKSSNASPTLEPWLTDEKSCYVCGDTIASISDFQIFLCGETEEEQYCSLGCFDRSAEYKLNSALQTNNEEEIESTRSVLDYLCDTFYAIGTPNDHINDATNLYSWLENVDADTKLAIINQSSDVELELKKLEEVFDQAAPFIIFESNGNYYEDDDTVSEYKLRYVTYLLDRYLANFGWARGTCVFGA